MSIEVTKRCPYLKIWVNDLYYPVYNFWKQLQKRGSELSKELEDLKNTHPLPQDAKRLFLQSKEHIGQTGDQFRDAVMFYVLNKCSFSGLSESSSFSSQASMSNFSMNGIKRLPAYQSLIQNWKITNESYEELLTNTVGVFTYLDPPYEISSNLYGKRGNVHKAFNHDIFAENCSYYNGHQLISYNDSQMIKERFDNKWSIDSYPLTYTMRSKGNYLQDQKRRDELVLYNYGI